MSDDTRSPTLKNVWDDVPPPGLPPPLPSGSPPAPGDRGFAEWNAYMRAYGRWLAAARRYQLASAIRELESPLTPEERAVQLDRAVRALGAMVLAGDVGPGVLGSLFDLF